LTVDYFRWRPTIHRRLSWLSLPLLSPTTDYCLRRLAHRLSLTFHSEILVLKWACANGIVDTYCSCSYMRCNGLVTGETSVVYSPCIAVGLFSG
jgi:hypothetical protein